DDMGWIHLPRPRRPSVRRRRVEITARSAPRPLPAFGPLDIESTSFLVVSGTGDVERERLWNEYAERYHYLGYGVPLGPHIKYFGCGSFRTKSKPRVSTELVSPVGGLRNALWPLMVLSERYLACLSSSISVDICLRPW